ncbi:MAG: hypothetical protein LDL09_06580 [Calditerrivibrio sp.]|nr:hypothetical protein [Calditerrivibrio sp.]
MKELENLSLQLNIKVRYEKTTAKGGLCKLNDQYMIIIDRKAKDDYKAQVIAKSLKQFDLSNVHLKPKIREFIDEA